MLQEVDWPAVSGGAAVFITTCYLTWKGWQDRKKEIQKPQAEVLAGVIQDNSSIRENTEAIRDLTVAINRQSDLLLLSAAIAKVKD